MVTAVNDINRKEMQEREEHRFAADFLRRRASSLPLPFRSLTTTGCFSRIRLPAADGADLNGEFQRSVRRAFAEAVRPASKTAAVRRHPVRYPAAFGAVYSAAEPLVRSRRLYGRRSAGGELP